MAMSYIDYRIKHRQHQKERGEEKPAAPAVGRQAGKSSPASSDGKKTNPGTSFIDYKINNRKEQVKQNGYERYGTYTASPQTAAQGPQATQMAAPVSQDNPYMKAAVRQTLPAYQRPVDPITAAAANMLRNNARGNIDLYNSPENSPLRMNNVAPRPYELGDAVQRFEQGEQLHKNDPEADRYIEKSIRTTKNPFANSGINSTIDPQTGDVTYTAEHGRNNWLNDYNVQENLESDEARKARADALNLLIARGRGDNRTRYESTVLRNMNEDEQKEYSYILGKFGREQAEKYLDRIGEQVTNRRAAEIVENVNRDVVPEEGNIPTSYVNPRTGEVIENARSGKNPVNSLARAGKMGKLAAQSGLDMFVSGVGDKFTNYVTGGTETTPATAEARASQAVKEQLNPLGRLAYDVVENEAMMLPTQAATVAAALLFPPLAPAAASVGTGASIGSLAAAKAAADAPQIFGIGATMFPMSAGQAYEEGLQKGLTPDQARFYGTLEGLNQAGLEYALGGFEDLSGGFAKQAVDNVLGNVIADETKSQAEQTVARAIQHFLTTPEGRMAFSMGSEAFEEIVQGSVSNALNNAFFGENNGPVSQEDLYSALVAALSAGMSNSRYYARGYANGIGRVYSAEDIRAAADNIITDRAAYVNQEAYDAAMEQRNQMLAQADYVEQGGSLTPLERGELGDAAGGALAEMDRIGRRARNESDIQEVADTLRTAQEIAQTEETKQEVEKISTRANDIIKRRAEGAQVTDAEVGRLINDTIRTTLVAGNEKAAATAEARTRMGFGEQGNTVMESSQATGQKAEALTALYEEARYDIQRNDAQKQLASTLLSEQELSAMYQAGIQDRNAFYNTDYSDKIGKIAEKYRPGNIKRGNVTYDGVDMDALQKAGDNESRAKYAQMKTIEHFLAGTLGYNVEWFESKTADGKYEGENGSYNRSKHLIRLDINAGAEVIGDKVKFASVIAHELTHTIEDGSPMQYQKIANTVMKALVADQEYSRGRNAEQIIADMIENNPYVKNEADAIHELVAQACEDMMNGNADIRAMFESMDESERNTIFDHISNIFAAIKNFFDDLLNSDAVQSNRTEAAAIRRAKENIESLEKEWTEGVKMAAAYNAAAYEESQRQAAEQASENEQMENAFGDETGRITRDEDGNVVIAESEDGQSLVYSLRTLPTTQAKLAEVLKRKGYSEESIKAAQDQVGTVADMLTRVSTYYAEMAEALDAELLVDPKTGKTVLHSFVTNGDYPVNIDFLTICKKREAYMHVLTDLIDHGIFDKVAFDGAAIATTNEILRDSGFETACACCFVESRRLQIQRWAETFCSEWNEEVLKRNPNATPFNFSKGDRGANSLTQDELIELDKELRSLTKKEKNDKGNYKIRQQGARAKMGPLLDRIPALGHTLSVGDLITPNGIDSMRTLDSNLFSLVKQRYGTATPKIAQAFSPYNGDVADLNYGFMRTEIKESITGSKKYKAEAKSALIKEGVKKPTSQQVEDRAIRKYLYDIGGVRLQSFSDFLIENTLDYFQMFADLAAKELPLHAYSKEISFIKIFGMTGGKLNMSLIPIVDLNTDRDHAGLKKNADGTYSYAGWGDYEHHLMIDNRSFIQSIGFKDAIALQLHPGYSSHVGTIAIGISNEHIKMMLNDPLIRMVIPYHSSGMLPEFAKQMHIDYYHDYTKTQNTTLGRCTDMDGNEVAVYNLKGNDSYSCDTHFDFNEAFQRLGDARMACEEYKEWCKQQHPVYYKNKQVGWAEFTPKFVEFADERNYYKLIEDFNSYDCITEESAIQGAVRMSFPGMEENLLNDEELKAYEERLRATGQFTEKEIQKYVSRANETLEEIVTREAKNRNAYHREMDKKYDSTLKKIEDKLQKNFNKNDYVLKDNKYVRKSGEQKSSRDTAARVGASGEQFAMRGTAEETKDLIAVHNLYEWKMKQLIKLSGLPAPSIAITKANDGWNKFGEISFVYDKDSIDPKKNRKNKIYGADAWTPTFPSVEYRVDTGILNKISEKLGEKIKDLLPQDIARDATNDIQRAQFDLNRMPVEEYVDRMSNSLALKAAYVASKGITVEDQQKVRGSSYKPQAVAGFDSLIEKIGNAVDEVYTEDANEFYDKHKQEILDAYNVYRDAAGLSKFEPADDSPMSRRVLIRFAEKACDYAHDTRANETIRDRDAIEKFVDSHFDRDGFDKWLTPMLSEAVLEEGLYNGKDRYTWSGTRKSWKQTHMPVTAENIVKVMMMGEKTGLASFESKNSFIASAQKNFKSIADVKKSKDRIKNLDDAEYKRLTDEVGKEFYKLADEIKSGNYGSQEAAEAIHDAVRKARTVDGIGRELRRWGGLNIGSDTAQRVYDVAKKAASIPTKYFEAKPERVVGFDEVKAAIVPADVAPEIKEWLDKQGITAVTYERDNDADRTRALNSVENVRFSSRNSTGNVSREVVDQVTDASVTAMIDNGYTEKEAAEAVEVGGFVQYSTRTAPAPKKTITAYKAFYAVDGKLYPPMVANDVEEEQNNDKKKSKKKGKKKVSGTLNGMETPVGIWIDADVGALAYDDDGKPLRNTKGRLAVKNAKGGGTLAFRPGWHLGLWPDAKQFNVKDPVTGKIKACMPDGLVFARCSVAADNDYQLEALGYGMGSNGKFNRTQAGLPRIPVDGYYMYRTNALPDTAPWIISGAIRVEEILDDDMAAEICKQYGITADPRASHKKINLADYGLKAGLVTPTEDTDRFLPNNAVKANAAALEEALNDPAYANAYVANSVNFDDPEIIKELERNGQSAEFYKTAQEKYGNKSYAVDNPNDSLINKNTFAVGSGNAQTPSRADIEAAADDPNNTNVIRMGSDQDVQYSSRLFSKDISDKLKANMATFFSGTGTVDFALRNIVNHEFAVEYDAKIAAVYKANNGNNIYVDDVRNVNINKHKGRVEYFHASPVCKNYSKAKNNAEELPLDFETAQATADAINTLQPKVVTVENVARYRNSEAIKIIEDALRKNGYTFDKGVYRASDFGGATIRERMFLRAVKDGVLPKIDTSEYSPMSWYDAVEDLIDSLPPATLPNYMQSRLEVSGIDLNNLSQPVFVLGGEASGKLTHATADKPAPTILAKSTEGKILMPDGRVLRATPRVMARIQGLPDAFDLKDGKGGMTNAYRVVGNGVPVQLTQGIVGPLLEENLIKQKSEATGIQYSIRTSDGEVYRGLTISDKDHAYSQDILGGFKKGETRAKQEPFLENAYKTGERIALIRSGIRGKFTAYATTKIGKPEWIPASEWERRRKDTRVPKGSTYDINGADGKWYYPFVDLKALKTEVKPTSHSPKYGRFDDVQRSARNMAELEAEYQEALDAKDEDWQLMLVDQAAYNAGYTVGAYHGSPFENIHIFNTRSQETKKTKMQLLFGTHFTHNLEYAKLYARKAKNSKGTSRMTSKEGQIYKTYLDLGKSLDLRTARNITPGMEEYKLYEDAPAKYQRHFKPYTFSKYDTEQGLGSGQYITAATIESVLQAMSPKEATDFLVDHGYNSILYDADYATPTSGNNRFTRDPSIIMLDPERIKSGDPVTYDDNGNVIPLSERFNPANEDIRYSSRNTGNAPTFYSKLQREIQNYKGEKIGAASVESYLKGKGVKDEEIKWSGIRTFLEGKKSVNKKELMDFLKANEIEIEQTILDDNPVFVGPDVDGKERTFRSIEEIQKLYADKYGEDVLMNEDYDDYMEQYSFSIGDEDYSFSKESSGDNETHWEGYRLDGGENYREILFRIPGSNYSNQAMSTHWNESGVLAHARVQDFDSSDGKKVLFVEEIQSDWHNAGQKEGYRGDKVKSTSDLKDAEKAYKEKGTPLIQKISKILTEEYGIADRYADTRARRMVEGNEPLDRMRKSFDEEMDLPFAGETFNTRMSDELYDTIKEAREYAKPYLKAVEEQRKQKLNGGLVPDAPFRTTYTDYVLKNLLRMAAEGDYDYLAWTTGKMQEERWSDEFAEGYRIEYDQQIPKFLKKYGKQWGAGLQNVKIYGGWDRAGNAPYVPAITVNELMKETVLTEGQPMFSARSNGFDQRTSFGTVEELERRNENIWHINYTLDQVLRDRGAQTQKVSDYQIKRIANRFLREYNSKADADTIVEGLKAMYEYIDYGAKISAQQVGKIATAYAEQIIDESKDVDDTMAAMYPGLADDIKRTKLYVSPEAMKEMAYYFDGAADFRRQAKKFLTISERPGDGRGIDTFYEELSESYPELFDPDVANEKDQLLQIFDVAEQLKAKTIDKDWGSEYDEVAYTLGQDLVAAYFAEKGDSSYKRSIDQIKVQMAKDHKEQMANLRRYKDQQIKEIKDKLTGERRMNTAQIAELRARLQEQYRQREEKASLRRLTTQAKARLQRQARQLWSKRGTPEFERLKAKLFSELDLVSVGITKGGRLSLERTYNEARKQAMLDPDYAASAEYENIKLKFLGDPANPAAERKHLRDLSYDEIVDLTQDIIALKHSQQTYNKVIKEGFEANVADYGRRAVAQQDRVKGILNQKGRRAQMLAAVKKYALYMENPVRAAHLLDGYQEGGVLTELFDDINDGTTKKTRFQQQANQMFEEILKDKKLTDGWSDQNIEINVGAGKYYISKGMRISIALHVRNADNIRHIDFGGFTIPDERLYKAGRYTDAYNAGTNVKMTEEEMKQIASEMTPEEKKFAGIAYQFFNHTTKDAINETSMVLKGYELAIVPNYMPIRTNPNFTQTEIDGLIHDGTIEGKGQFKDRQPGAKNPILLEDIAQVIERQTQTTAAYCGLAIPVRNMNKVWKYTATAYKASIKDAVAKNWGELGKDTIEKMLKDIQAGARRGDTGDHVFSFLKGAQAASTLTMNVGVSMKQFASYPLAISMLDADCLMKGLRAKTDRAYIDSITPWSWDRRHGMGGEEMGDIFKQKGMIARNENIQKIKNMVNWIQAVDVFTTDHLFAACEAQVQKDNPDLEVRGKEYNEKVAALYNDVLWRTQPSYGVMQRNELMRSASTIMKALTMYKTQTFNMGGEIIDAGLRAVTMRDMAKDGLVSNDEVTKANQNLRNVLWGTVLSQATLAALSAVAAAFLRKMRPYRDDKGKITAGSLMQKVGTDFITSWFGLFFGADLAEQAVGSVLNFAKWYDVTAPQLNGLNDTVNDMSEWSTALGNYIGETDVDKKAEKKAKLVKTSAKMAMTTAGTFGVPTNNVYNMLNALNLLAQDVSEGNGFLSFEAGKGLLGLTDTSPTKEQYARQAVYYSERDDADKVAHALQGTNKSNLEKVLGMKLTKNLYDSFMDDPENLAKFLNVKQGVSAPKPSDVPDDGYASFTKLREAIGDPERTQNWHHIVEQEQMDEELSGFKSTQINNKNNIVSIPAGAKSPHSKISEYYNSVQDFTGGKTVREWLSTKSFDEQFDFGVKQLQKYGDIIPTSNGWVYVPDEKKIETEIPLEKGKAEVRTELQKQWETRIAEAREDKSLKDREVRDIALTMISEGLSADEAMDLYKNQKKNDGYLDKWEGGFEDYLKGRNAIDDAKAIKDKDKKLQKEKRKQAVEDYLRQYHGTEADELLLWKLADYSEKTFEYH